MELELSNYKQEAIDKWNEIIDNFDISNCNSDKRIRIFIKKSLNKPFEKKENINYEISDIEDKNFNLEQNFSHLIFPKNQEEKENSFIILAKTISLYKEESKELVNCII